MPATPEGDTIPVLTDTEIEFLNARLDEDEAAARLAAREGGTWTQDDATRYPGAISSLGGPVVYDEGSPDEYQAVHIARYDPNWALRDIAVWRRLLLEYRSAPLDAVYGGTERETGFRLALSVVLKAKIATYEGNPVTGEPFPQPIS